MRWSDSITDLLDMNLSKLQERVKDRGAWQARVHGVPKSRTWFNNRTTATIFKEIQPFHLRWQIYGHKLIQLPSYYTLIGWLKSSFGFFRKILWKNPNKRFSQLSISCIIYYGITSLIPDAGNLYLFSFSPHQSGLKVC